MSFKGHARKHGRRWFSADPRGKRGKTYWRVLGDFKLGDILANARSEELMAAIKDGRVRYEPANAEISRVVILDRPGSLEPGDERPKGGA